MSDETPTGMPGDTRERGVQGERTDRTSEDNVPRSPARTSRPRLGPGHLDQHHQSRMLALMVLYEVDFSDHPAAEVLARTLADPDADSAIDMAAEDEGDEGDPFEPAPDQPAQLSDESAIATGDPGLATGGDDAWHTVAMRTTDLVNGTVERLAEIDLLVSAAAPAFPLRQVAGVDRNVLRLATLELLEAPESGAVVVNDAVELAKRFGGERSGSFVNGVLRTISERLTSQSRSGQGARSPSRRRD